MLWLPGRMVPLCCSYLGEWFLCAVATWDKGSFVLWLPGRKVPLAVATWEKGSFVMWLPGKKVPGPGAPAPPFLSDLTS